MRRLARSDLLVGKVDWMKLRCGEETTDCRVGEGDLVFKTPEQWEDDVGLNLG